MEEQQQPKNQSDSLEEAATVTSFRATPEELTAAILAIERRNAAEAERIAKTVAVEQVVHELGIEATPDEIVAEIQAKRRASAKPMDAKKAPVQVITATPPTTEIQAFFGCVIPLIVAVLIMIVVFSSQHSANEQDSSIPLSATVSPVPVQPPQSTIETLVSVPEDHAVTCDTPNLETLIRKGNQHFVRVTDGGSPDSTAWTLVKMDGHVYIRGYFTSQYTQDALDIGPVTLYNSQTSASTQVWLRTDRVRYVSAMNGSDSNGSPNSQMTLSHVKLDGTAYGSPQTGT